MLIVDEIYRHLAPLVTCGRSSAFGRRTALAPVTLWSSTYLRPAMPGVFTPMFYVVLKGSKVLTVGGKSFALDAGDCAASAFGAAYFGELTSASRETPYVGVSVDLDPDILNDVMLDMPKSGGGWASSPASSKLDGPLGETLVRYIGLLNDEQDREMLARAYERELYYRLLRGPMAATIRQIAQRDDRTQRIKTAADWLSNNHDKPVAMAELATSVGMSPTSFYRHFKAITGRSPLIFQRQTRLWEARRLLGAGDLSVAKVAFAVGYISAPQFSREYKRMFGTAPIADRGTSKHGGAA